jgi:AcrR family transcriptional regulator
MKELKKDKIIDADKILFSEKGYAATGLREIATKANVSLGNIYNHFKNKEEIFMSILDPSEIANALYEKFKIKSDGIPYNLDEIILELIKAIDENIHLYALINIDISEFEARNTRRMVDYFIEQGKTIFIKKIFDKITDGTLRPFDYEFLFKYFFLTTISFFTSIRAHPTIIDKKYTDKDIAKMLSDIILNGVTK